MKCPNCGKEIANDSKFCEYCGIRIEKKFNKIEFLGLLCVIIGLLPSLYWAIYNTSCFVQESPYNGIDWMLFVGILAFWFLIISCSDVVYWTFKKSESVNFFYKKHLLLCLAICFVSAIILFITADLYSWYMFMVVILLILLGLFCLVLQEFKILNNK